MLSGAETRIADAIGTSLVEAVCMMEVALGDVFGCGRRRRFPRESGVLESSPSTRKRSDIG